MAGNPELAKKPDVAADVAVAYWNERVDRAAAANGDVRTVTRNINGGYNGLQDRIDKFKKYSGNPNYTAPGGGLVASSSSSSSSASGSSGDGSTGSSGGGGFGGLVALSKLATIGPSSSSSSSTPSATMGSKATPKAPPAPPTKQTPKVSVLDGNQSSGGNQEVPKSDSGANVNATIPSPPKDLTKCLVLGIPA